LDVENKPVEKSIKMSEKVVSDAQKYSKEFKCPPKFVSSPFNEKPKTPTETNPHTPLSNTSLANLFKGNSSSKPNTPADSSLKYSNLSPQLCKQLYLNSLQQNALNESNCSRKNVIIMKSTPKVEGSVKRVDYMVEALRAQMSQRGKEIVKNPV
jgi:hypothetical protein